MRMKFDIRRYLKIYIKKKSDRLLYDISYNFFFIHNGFYQNKIHSRYSITTNRCVKNEKLSR